MSEHTDGGYKMFPDLAQKILDKQKETSIRHSISLHQTFSTGSAFFRCIGKRGKHKSVVVYEFPEACAFDLNAISVIRKHLQREVLHAINYKESNEK